MSKAPKIRPRDHFNLEKDDIIDYLYDKDVTLTCELCRNDSWYVNPISDEMIPYIPYRDIKAENESGKGTNALFMICKNCGNMRTFFRRAIVQWKIDRDLKEIADQEDLGEADE